MAITKQTQAQTDHEEGYFVSMTDMMVGMLFLFIIMLMFFALKFNEAAVEHNETVQDLLGSDKTRGEILTEIQRSMEMQGVAVRIDEENGILRLPESILFDRNKSELTYQGMTALQKLAASLEQTLRCYAFLPGMERPYDCAASIHSIESIFVEGHTDSDGDADLNWRLSMERALRTYQALTGVQAVLAQLLNRDGKPILSISGYGKQRPAFPNDTDDSKRLNRRIDLRFIMAPPKAQQSVPAGLEVSP